MIKNVEKTEYGNLEGMVWNELFQTDIFRDEASEDDDVGVGQRHRARHLSGDDLRHVGTGESDRIRA